MEFFLSWAADLAEIFFLYVAVLVFSLALVILIHEFGHYLAARFFKVRVEKYSIGFGKEIYGRDDKHGTRWSLSIFPFGGYVKLFGDVDIKNPVVWDYENDCERLLSEDELAVSFCTKPVWQRMFIVLAGPMINFILAVALLFSLYFFYGQASRYPVINALGLNSASHDDGFQLGDEVLEMDGQRVRRFKDVYDLTSDNPGKPFEYKVLRDGRTLTIVSAPRAAEYIDTKGVEMSHGRTGMLRFGSIQFDRMLSLDGVSVEDSPDKARDLLQTKMDQDVVVGSEFRANKEDFFIIHFPSAYNKHLSDPDDEHYDRAFVVDPDEEYYLPLGFVEALQTVFESIGNLSYRSYQLFRFYSRGKTEEPLIGGVAKVSEYAADSAKSGVHSFVQFLAVFSLLVAFINILPVPMLDGGFLVFLVYEWIVGKQVPPRVQNYAFTIGLVFIGGIVIFANLYDLINLLGSLL